MERRARMLATRRDELRGQMLRDSMRKRQKEGLSMMRQVVDVLKLLQNQQTDKLHDRLSRPAALRDAVVVFLFFKVATPVLLAAVTFSWSTSWSSATCRRRCGCSRSSAAPCSASSCPSSTCRTDQEAPAGAEPGIARRPRPPGDLRRVRTVARRRAGSGRQRDRRRQPELAEELSLTSIELGFLPERRQALLNLNRRTNLPSIRGVVNTLMQTEKYGTPLSQSLRVLANEFRDQRLLKAEEKAARLPATLTVPMIVFILPVLFIVLIGPAVIKVMDTLL